MIKNYLKTAIRNLQYQKGFSFINLSGLAIGIRKVLGASVSGIIKNLTMEFLRWVAIANIIAIPAAIILLRRYWLVNFSFQAGISIWTFVLASGLSVVIAFLTVYYQSYKAATANPIHSIRNE